MPQNNQEIYESLFNSNEEFKNAFPSQQNFEEYISTSPTKLDKIYNRFGTPSPITVPDPADEPVKKKERGSFFRSLFSGGKNKPQVEGGSLTPMEATPVSEQPVVPILPRAKGVKIDVQPLLTPETALDEYYSAVKLDDEAKQSEAIASFGPDIAQEGIDMATRTGEVIANMSLDLAQNIEERFRVSSRKNADVQWEPVKLNVPIDVIEKQGRRKLTYGLVLEKEKEAKKAAKFIIEQSLLDGARMTEEIGKYMDKETKEEKGWPVLTPESQRLVMELSENKVLSAYRPEEEGKVGLSQLVKESRVPYIAKIEEYALMAFKQYKPNVEGVGLQRKDGTLIASDEEIKNDPRFQIIKETLIDMVTDGIQRDNFESAFDIELKKEFPDNKEIQEKGIRALSSETTAMLQNTAATFNKKSEKEFNAYIATKSAPFLKFKAEKSALVESAFSAFQEKYDYDENLNIYFGGNKSQDEFEKDRKDLEKLVDSVNQEVHEKSLVLQKEIETYQQGFIKDQEVKLSKEMKSLGSDIDNRIKKIAKRVGQEVAGRQQLAEQNAFEQNSLAQNMVNAYAAGSADQFRGYSLMIRTITGGRSILTDALEDLADMSYVFETSIQTQWYKSKDENGKALGWWDAIKNSFRDIETSKETISDALVEIARTAPAMTGTMVVGAAGGGFGLTMSTALLNDTAMEMVEGYKGALATSGSRRTAELVADKIYKKQLGYLITYVSDAITFTPKSLGKIVNLSSAARIAGAKLAINQFGESMQEVHQGFGHDWVKSEILDNKPFSMSFTDYAKENALDLSMAVLPQTLLFGGAGSAIDTYSQLTEEKRAQDAVRLFDELGFTNYILNATRDLGRNGALAMGEMMYVQGQISLEQAQKFQQAAIRLTEFSEAAETLAPNSAQRSHAIVGLMSDKYEQQNRLNSVTTEQAKDQIKDEIKKIDAEIENIKNGKMEGYSVITDVKSGRIIAALSDIKLKKLIAGTNQESYAFLTQVALGGFSLNTKDLKIKDLVDRYKVFLDNSADTKKKISDIENKKEADKVDAAEKRKAGQKDVPTDEEIDAKANAQINNVNLEAFVPVFLSQGDVNNDLREYKEKQVVNTANIDIPNTIEINEKTTPQEIDNFVLGADNHQKVNMAMAQVKAVMPLMQSMFPNSKIVIVKGDEEMKQITGSDTPEEGFFYQGLEQTYEGSKTNKVYDTKQGKKLKSEAPTIYLNLQRMTEFTVYHETVHAALLKAFGADPTLMKNFKGGVESILDKNMKARLDKWLADRNYSDNIKDEEYLAQLGAFLKSEGKNIKMSMWQKLKGLVLTTLNKMGFKSLENRVNTFYDAKQMVDFFNQLTKGQITGVTADSFVPFDAPAEQKQRRSRTNAEDTATETLGERARRSGMVRFSYTPSSQQAFQYLDEMMNHAVDKYGFKKKEDSLDGDKRYTDLSRANRMVHIGLDKSINIAPNANLNTNDLLSVTNRLMVNILFHADGQKWNNIVKAYGKVNKKTASLFDNISNTEGVFQADKNVKSNQKLIDGINEISAFVYRYTNNTLLDSVSEIKAAESIWSEMSDFFISRPVSHLGGAYNILSAWSSQQPTAQKQALNEEEVLESIRNNAEVPANEQIGMFMDGVGNLIPSQVRKSLARTDFALGLFDTLANKFPELKIDTLDNNARLEAVKKAFENGDISERMYERALQVPVVKTLRVDDLGDYKIHYDNLDDLITAYSAVLLLEIQKLNPGVWANILQQTERTIPEVKEVFERFRQVTAIPENTSENTFRNISDDTYNNPEAIRIKNEEIIPYLANLLADNARNYLTATDNNQVDLANRIIEDLKNGFNERDDVNYNILPASTGLEQLALLLIDPKVKLKSDFYERSMSSDNKAELEERKELKRLMEDPNTKLIVDPMQPVSKAITLDSTKEEKAVTDETLDLIVDAFERIIQAGENSQEYIDAANLGFWPNNNYIFLEMHDMFVRTYKNIATNVQYEKDYGNYTKEFEVKYTKDKIRNLLRQILNDINVHSYTRQERIDALIKLTGEPKIIEKIQPLYKPLPHVFRDYIYDISGTENNYMVYTSYAANSASYTQNQLEGLKQEIADAITRQTKDFSQKGKSKREGSFFIYDDNGNVIDEMTTDGTLVDEGPGTLKGIYMNFKSKKYGYGSAPSGSEADSETRFRRNVVNDAAAILLRFFADENISYIQFTPATQVPEKYRNDPTAFRQRLYNNASTRLQGKFAQNLDKRAQVIPVSPIMRLGEISNLVINYDNRFKPLDKSQIRQSQAANHQKIKQEVDSMRQQNVPDADIFASLFNKYGYEDMRTSAFGVDFMNAADAFIDAKAEEGLNKYAAEFAKRQTGIRNFLDAYYGTAPLLTLVNKLREGVLFVDDTNYALPAGMTYLFDPNSVQLRETSQQEGTIYKFADYEIFRSLFDAGETSSTLSQIFGPQFRQTIQRVLDRNEMASDILTGLEQDARSLKVKRSIEELRELGEIFDDMDATAIVKWLVNKLATGGIEEAVQVLIDRLNGAETFADLEDQMNLAFYESAKSEDIQALSGLGSFAGRVLRLMRQVAKKPEQLLIENAESNGLVIPPKLKAQIEEASKKKIQAYEDYKKALKTFMEDFNDLNGLALIAAEKNYDDMAFEFARIVNVTAVQPGFWSNNLIKASAFALLSVNTVFVSGVSVLEILGRTLALPSALTRFLVDKYITKAQINPTFALRAQTNPFTKAYWRNAKNAFAYTAQPSFYEMARVMATGQQQNKNISLVDQPTNMNSFRDAHNIVQLFMRYLDKQKGALTVEEIADYMEAALLEVETGQVNAQGVPTTELKLADSFVIMNTFFRGILAQPALGQSELMVRLMPLGLDRFGANAIAMNSMLTYINLQMENDYANMPESLLKALQSRNAGYATPSSLPSVPGQPIPNTTMDDVTLQKNMSRLMAGLFATGQLGRDVFETEALKATFFSDNSITRGVSSVRTGLQRRMKNNYYRYLAEKRKGKEGSFVSKASSAAALHLNQVGNVAQFAVLPFVKVPTNIGIAVLTRSNPLSAMLHSVAMGTNYNEVFREMKDKYKLDMTANTALTIPGNIVIPKTSTAKQIEVEKDMMKLYEAKRKYLQSVGDITGSTIFAGAVYMVVMSGAVTPSDDPDKRTLMSEMGLKSSELNISYLKDYLLESAKRGEFVDGKEFARKRGKANPNDLKVNLINLGTYLSYGLGFGADLYQANQTRQNESNDVFEGLKSYYTYGTVFQNMTRTLFKMTPSVKFIEDVLQVLDTNQGKKDWGKDMDDIAGSLFATVGAAAAPSLLGKPLSVSEAQVIQGPKDVEISKEIERYPWPLNIKPVLIAHMRMSRNGIIFPGFLRSDFYQSGIGAFGEDLTLRRTLNAPNTGAAYAESMLNFFSMRKEAIVTPDMASQEFVRHQEVQSFVSGISYLATVYFQLEKDPTNFYKAFNRPGKNSFVLTDSPEGERGENVNKPIKLPNDIFRDEARILGSYRYAVIEEFNTQINNFIEDVKTREIETPEEKEQLAVEISKYMDRLVQKMSDVENQYKSDFLLNRANDIAGELERRRVLVKNPQQDEKQRLIEIGVAPEVFENIDLYRWTPSFDKQGRIIKPKTSESISKLKK